MTRKTNARVAGFTFLLYIVLGVASMIVAGRAASGKGIAAKLATMAEHSSDVHIAVILTLLTSFCALVLGVTLYALTRDQDSDLAMLGLTCRVGEGVIGALSVSRSLGLLWLATVTGENAPDAASARAIGAFFQMGQAWSSTISATFFAVGSTLFSWLFLRGRMIPASLAWLGVIASALLVVGLPLQIAGVLSGSNLMIVWYLMLAFEVPFALWLMIKGATMPVRR